MMTADDLTRITDRLERGKRASEYLARKEAERRLRTLECIRNVLRIIALLTVLALMASVAVKAIEKAAHDVHQAQTSLALFQSGY